MVKNQPKRLRKEYLHHFRRFALPKSTYCAAQESGEADATEATASTSGFSSADGGERRSPAVKNDVDTRPLLADDDIDEALLIEGRCDFDESGAENTAHKELRSESKR
ncbi:hypothetical protein MRX96_047148 [Rhipicephalus microplus]